MDQPKKNKKNPDLARLLGGDISQVEKKITGTEPTPAPAPSVESPAQTPAAEVRRMEPVKEEAKVVEQEHPTNSSIGVPATTQVQPPDEDELIFVRDEDLSDLPRSFTKYFKRNPAYDKFRRTSALVYLPVLEEYKKISAAMGVDNLVLMNNVLIEWFNKNIDTCEKVMTRKSKFKSF